VNELLPQRLEARLQLPLPNWAAQVRYQPELSFGRHRGPAEHSARQAAVLVALYPRDGQWHLPLIVRPQHMLDHAGQVSLPGGVIEPGESGREAALREYGEELGAPPENVQLLGRLSDLYLFASNFCIEPWVGVVRDTPRWVPNQHEVEQVLDVPLTHLLDRANSSTFERRVGPIAFQAPCFCFDSQCIWGATCLVLAELAAALAELPVEEL
jgi:8-oxo-dGTP pyrophosphatase MutT (NUDIX family)